MIEHDRGPELGGGTCAPGAVLSVPLTETSPGVYETFWTVPADLPAGVYDVVGCLTVAGEAKAATPPAVLIVQTPPPVSTGPGQPPTPSPPAPTPPSGTPTTQAPVSPPPAGAPHVAPPNVVPVYLVPQPPLYPPAPGGDANLPPAPSWSAAPTRSVPAGELWVTPDDYLVLGVRNSLAGVGLTMAVRMWDPSGQFVGGTVTVHPPSDRSLNYYTMPLSYGYLCEVSVVASTGTPVRGQTLVQVLAARGPTTAFTTYGVLCQDYVTSYQAVGYPASGVKDSTSRPGASNYFRSASGATSIPTAARWVLAWAQTYIQTTATVKTRWPFITYTPYQTSATNIDLPAFAGVGASKQGDFYWIRGLGSGAQDTTSGILVRTSTPLPDHLELYPGGNLQFGWDNLDGGNDSVQFWYFFYEEVLEVG